MISFVFKSVLEIDAGDDLAHFARGLIALLCVELYAAGSFPCGDEFTAIRLGDWVEQMYHDATT